MSQLADKDWYCSLKMKNDNYLFPKTKVITRKKQTNAKILALLNDNAEVVSQLSNSGLIVLDKTILNSCDNKSISEQGIIRSAAFKARIIDVNNKIIKGVYFHYVKVISGIIAINQDHQVILESDEEFNRKLLLNKLAVRLFTLFFNQSEQNKVSSTTKNQINIDAEQFQLRFNKKSQITKDLILQIRNLVNKFLSDKKLDYQKYPFLENSLTKSEIKNIFKLEKIEVTNFEVNGSSFIVSFLVGREKINQFFLQSKKELLSAIKVINKKIKVINNDDLISQFYPNDEIKTYEDLESLEQDYLALKINFANFQNNNSELMKNLVDQSVATQYSEKIADYEVVHISFNNFLIDKGLLELKANERLGSGKNKVLFLSNNNLDNSLLVWKISSDLINKINLMSLVKKTELSFIKIDFDKNDSVFIESNNYQLINDFIQKVIKLLKTQQPATI